MNEDSRPETASSNTQPALAGLLRDIRACRICVDAPTGKPLPHEPRPVLRASATARIMICGQAPGVRVHQSGTPFTDPSGVRLRAWMGIGEDVFYDEARIAVVPMGFCFPGLNAQGSDLPPRRECRQTWHDALFAMLPDHALIIAVGTPAQRYHLTRLGARDLLAPNLHDTVMNWREIYARTRVMPMPHPSWRNSGWLNRNPWFGDELVPVLQAEVQRILHLD